MTQWKRSAEEHCSSDNDHNNESSESATASLDRLLIIHTNLQGCLALESALIAQFPGGKHARLAQIGPRLESRSRNIRFEL